MRSKFWWFTSAVLIWAATAFIALVAMLFESLEYLFTAQDDAAVTLAGGYAIFLAAGASSALAWVIAGPKERRSGFRAVCGDLAAQAGAVALGGLIACLFSLSALVALAAGAAAFIAAARYTGHDEDRAWIRPGLIGLAAASSGFVIVIVHL